MDRVSSFGRTCMVNAYTYAMSLNCVNTPEFIAKCKELFSGVPATGITNSVTVKRKGPVEIPRTPIVLLTNHDIRVRFNSIDANAMKSRLCAMKGLTPFPNSQWVLKNLHPYPMKVLCDKNLYDLADTAKIYYCYRFFSYLDYPQMI